jgi:hypothetical protein
MPSLNNKLKLNGLKLLKMVNGSTGLQLTNTGTLSTNSTTTQHLNIIMMINPITTLLSKFKLEET